jgi:EpsI family protein
MHNTADEEGRSTGVSTMRNNLSFGLAILLLCAAVLLLYTGLLLPNKGATCGAKTFPVRVGDFTVEDVQYDQEVMGVLAADHVVYKRFLRSDRTPITLFVALYEGLEKTDFSHSPIVCFSGQGWSIDRQTKEELLLNEANRRTIRVNQLIQSKMGIRMITLFWYQCRRGVIDNRGFLKLALFYDGLFGRSGRNAFVRVTAVVPEEKSAEETAASLGDFVREVYPTLNQYVMH